MSSVVIMYGMLHAATGVIQFDVSSLTSMCWILNSLRIFNRDASEWDVSNFSGVQELFHGAL